MARKVFVSVLGTGFYASCKYVSVKNDFVSSETRFIQQATLEVIGAKEWSDKDKVLFLLTEKAKITNWDKSITKRKKYPEAKEESYESLESLIAKMSLPFEATFRNIPDGKDEDEMWQIFGTIFDELQEGDELYFDVTHSFRYLPMLVLVLNNYAKFLKNMTTKHISYGNYEARDEITNEAPIVDLLPLSLLQDWTFAAADYIKNGNAKQIANLSMDKVTPVMKETQGKDNKAASVKSLVNCLTLFVDTMTTCRGLDIYHGGKINNVLLSLSEVDKDFIKPFSPIIKKIEESFSCFNGKESAGLTIAAARWCFNNKMYQQAVTILQEGVVTFFCQRHNLNIRDEKERENVNTVFYMLSLEQRGKAYVGDVSPLMEKILVDEYLKDKNIVVDFGNLTDIRNDVDHSGMRKKPLESKNLISNIEKCLDSFEEILFHGIDSEVGVDFNNAMLINLSNHPFSSWSTKQRQAAEVYGECIDLPFPAINPSWDEEQIEKLSCEYFDKVIAMGSGHKQVTVHLMGELTFCFSLLRKLQRAGIRCVASCAQRNVEEAPDGVKRVIFAFENFREYVCD